MVRDNLRLVAKDLWDGGGMSLLRPERAASGLDSASAFAVEFADAAVSANWGTGGTWLLNTVWSALPQFCPAEAPVALWVVDAARGPPYVS